MREELEYKSIDAQQKDAINECKTIASLLLDTMDSNVPYGNELTIAITKIEEAVMWISKGISHN